MGRKASVQNAGLRRAIVSSFWLALVAALLFAIWQRDRLGDLFQITDPSSEAAFEEWLEEEAGRAKAFADFEEYLTRQGVADVLPPWQLARIAPAYVKQCDLPGWVVPPKELWSNIVPALKLVRDHVVPKMGPVEIASAYRTPELNLCAGGAGRSRHMNFEALDLVLQDRPSDLAAHYRTLCDIQSRAGPASRMGLGAYFDPADPDYNLAGRFHIDAAGYRNWGRSYTSASSPCPLN